MTQQAATILKRARERMTEARETHAAGLVSWAAVTAAIGAAAGRGEAKIELAAPAGVDLREAPTAAETVRKLTAGGFTAEWLERLPTRPGDPKIWVLVVGW